MTGVGLIFAVAFTLFFAMIALIYLVDMIAKIVSGSELDGPLIRIAIVTFCTTAAWFLFENFVR